MGCAASSVGGALLEATNLSAAVESRRAVRRMSHCWSRCALYCIVALLHYCIIACCTAVATAVPYRTLIEPMTCPFIAESAASACARYLNCQENRARCGGTECPGRHRTRHGTRERHWARCGLERSRGPVVGPVPHSEPVGRLGFHPHNRTHTPRRGREPSSHRPHAARRQRHQPISSGRVRFAAQSHEHCAGAAARLRLAVAVRLAAC